MGVLIVGSLAYDSVTSPAGSVRDELGGSATYGGLASQFHLNRFGYGAAALVGVVGADFRDEDRAVLASSGLDLSGLEIADGATFRWEGEYVGNMAEAMTHATHLNVFEHFKPQVPPALREPTVLFCANLHPLIQRDVIEQTSARRLVMLDSMNLWIDIARDALLDIMRMVDLVVINDGEARMLAEDDNLVRAIRALKNLTGVATLVVKRGEHGVLALHGDELIALPAFPTAEVVDPTGCGDTFAGTLAACLGGSTGHVGLSELREALMLATVTSSFTLESFGTAALRTLDVDVFDQRWRAYRTMLGL